LILLAVLVYSCSEKPSKSEIENAVQDIQDKEQRAQFVKILSDDNAREAIKELLKAA
jgi:hypothetical protein